MKMSNMIKGNGIVLRELENKDIEMIRIWRNQEDVRNNFVNSDIISPEQQINWYNAYCLSETDLMFIIEEAESLRPIGSVSLYNINTKDKVAEFGRLMIGERSFRGKGIALKASSLICKYAFDKIGLEVIYLDVFPDNKKAIKLYLTLGFKKLKDVNSNKPLIRMFLNKYEF